MRFAAELPADGLSALVVFFSPDYDADEFAAAMAHGFPGVPVYGCSTAGELTPDGLSEGGVVALGFRSRDFTIVAQPIAALDRFQLPGRARPCPRPYARAWKKRKAPPPGARASGFCLSMACACARRR